MVGGLRTQPCFIRREPVQIQILSNFLLTRRSPAAGSPSSLGICCDFAGGFRIRTRLKFILARNARSALVGSAISSPGKRFSSQHRWKWPYGFEIGYTVKKNNPTHSGRGVTVFFPPKCSEIEGIAEYHDQPGVQTCAATGNPSPAYRGRPVHRAGFNLFEQFPFPSGGGGRISSSAPERLSQGSRSFFFCSSIVSERAIPMSKTPHGPILEEPRAIAGQ